MSGAQLADDGQTLQATLCIESDTLTVETNSERRFDALLHELTGHDGSLELVQESRTPPDHLPSEEHDPEPLDPSRPELAEALQQHIEAYEQRWLDEAIPALSGYTPRQAAHDPTRRDDLLRLLDTFPAADNPGMMNPQRLRAQLGLD